MIILDYQGRRPIYEQITEKFRTLIYQGALPGRFADFLLSGSWQWNYLSTEYDSESLYTLEQEGLIYPVKGKGNFVAETQQIQEKSKEDFSKRIFGTCQTWNQHRYDRRRTDDIGSERV